MTTPREARSLSACAARFQRSKNSSWETGIAVLPWVSTSDVSLIVDLDGKPVEDVWHYHLAPSQGCFTAADVQEFAETEDNRVAAAREMSKPKR